MVVATVEYTMWVWIEVTIFKFLKIFILCRLS
jgi:hypothetical protein